MQDKDEGDVFDIVDEDKYENIVEGRRKGGDFVVDDGNLVILLNMLFYKGRCIILFIVCRWSWIL